MITRKSMRAGIHAHIKSLFGRPHRRLARRSWSFTEAEFWDYQRDAFVRLYEHATRSVPYYANRPDAYVPSPNPVGADVRDLLAQLPVLPKQEVREKNAEFWAAPLPRLATSHTTSGTSGSPLVLKATLPERGFQHAIVEEWRRRITGSRNPRTLTLSGFMTPSRSDAELYWYDPLTRNAFLSIYSLGSDRREEIIGFIRSFRPQFIFGYASSMHLLSLLVGDDAMPHRENCAAIVTSEVLYPHWRQSIERSLCRKVFNQYGSQEGAHLVMECEAGRMHINPLMGIVEIRDAEDGPVAPGEIGDVVVTSLIRRTMPLIRYRIGDTAVSTGYAADCPCGLRWPMIGDVTGRSEDFVVTRDGRRIGYLCFHATKNLGGIKEAQIVQRGYDTFVCNIVEIADDPTVRETNESRIRDELARRIGHRVEVEFQYLAEVPRGANGKFKAVLVEMSHDGVTV